VPTLGTIRRLNIPDVYSSAENIAKHPTIAPQRDTGGGGRSGAASAHTLSSD